MTSLAKVELTALADLIERKLALEATVKDISHRLPHDWQLRTLDEDAERERRRKALKDLKDGYADRLHEAEEYVEAPIIDRRSLALNTLAEATVELANIRRQMKSYL